MDYTIGYKAVNRRRITGAAVLNRIKYRKLRVVGAGANGIVLTDGRYAIKVGSIYTYDYQWLNNAASYGLAVPVVYCELNTIIDSRIANFIRKNPAKRNGEVVNIEEYLSDDNYADIMISMLATPFLDNECNIPHNSAERAEAYAVSNKVKYHFEDLTGDEWGDPHPWNLGIYRGGLIIIDP